MASASAPGRFTDYVHIVLTAGPIEGLFDDAANPAMPIVVAVAKAAGALKSDLKAHLFTGGIYVDSADIKAITAKFSLSRDEVLAIYLYTVESPLYHLLNESLRNKARGMVES